MVSTCRLGFRALEVYPTVILWTHAQNARRALRSRFLYNIPASKRVLAGLLPNFAARACGLHALSYDSRCVFAKTIPHEHATNSRLPPTPRPGVVFSSSLPLNVKSSSRHKKRNAFPSFLQGDLRGERLPILRPGVVHPVLLRWHEDHQDQVRRGHRGVQARGRHRGVQHAVPGGGHGGHLRRIRGNRDMGSLMALTLTCCLFGWFQEGLVYIWCLSIFICTFFPLNLEPTERFIDECTGRFIDEC